MSKKKPKIRSIKTSATTIDRSVCYRLMYDWINDQLVLGGEHSYCADIYRHTLEEGKLSKNIAVIIAEMVSDDQKAFINRAFPGFEKPEYFEQQKSRAFVRLIHSLSRDRLESVLFFYLMYEVTIDGKDLKSIAKKLRSARDEKIRIETDQVVYDQNSLAYFKIQNAIKGSMDRVLFEEISWDLYPRKAIVKTYSRFCKKIIQAVK